MHSHCRGVIQCSGSIKQQLGHRVVLSITGPKEGTIDHSGSGNEGVTQFQAMTASIRAQIVASLPSYFAVDGSTAQSKEQAGEGSVFGRAHSLPQL